MREWLLYNSPKVIKTPVESPDFNPIENCWKELNEESTSQAQRRAKEKAVREMVRKHVRIHTKNYFFYAKTLRVVIENEGYATKYCYLY